MPGEVDISALLGGQSIVDETDLPDAGGEELDEGGQETDAPSGQETQPAATDEPEVPVTGKRNPKVPLAALQEERTRRQEYQDQLKAQQESYARLEQRTNLMLQQFMQQQQAAQQEQQPEAVQIPSFTEDPEGHVQGLRAQFEQQMQQLVQQNQQYQAQQQANVQNQQLASWASAQEQAFQAKQADYPAAAAFFAQRKALEYQALGADPVSIQAQVVRDYQNLCYGAAQNNRNPAELMYNLAKAMGYTPQKQQPAASGKLPAAPKQAPTSLSNVEGVRTPDEEGELTADGLAQMSDAEFDKLWAKMSRGTRQGPRF